MYWPRTGHVLVTSWSRVGHVLITCSAGLLCPERALSRKKKVSGIKRISPHSWYKVHCEGGQLHLISRRVLGVAVPSFMAASITCVVTWRLPRGPKGRVSCRSNARCVAPSTASLYAARATVKKVREMCSRTKRALRNQLQLHAVSSTKCTTPARICL